MSVDLEAVFAEIGNDPDGFAGLHIVVGTEEMGVATFILPDRGDIEAAEEFYILDDGVWIDAFGVKNTAISVANLNVFIEHRFTAGVENGKPASSGVDHQIAEKIVSAF